MQDCSLGGSAYWSSKHFSCLGLLQVEQICHKFSRMHNTHITATKKYDIKSFKLHG